MKDENEVVMPNLRSSNVKLEMIFVVSHSSTVKNCFCVLNFIPILLCKLDPKIKKLRKKLMTKDAICVVIIFKIREPNGFITHSPAFLASLHIALYSIPKLRITIT